MFRKVPHSFFLKCKIVFNHSLTPFMIDLLSYRVKKRMTVKMQKTILTGNINDFMGLQFEPTAEVK